MTARTVAPESAPIAPLSFVTRSMGGRLAIHLDAGSGGAAATTAAADIADAGTAAAAELAGAGRESRRAAARIETWAARLTRHEDASDLSRLNADPGELVAVRPTLAAALAAGREAMLLAPGYVDIALLDARLAAETGRPAPPAAAQPATAEWSLARTRHGSALVRRAAGVRFDLGGVGKGWIADRALQLLHDFPSAIVDADGDMAVRSAPGRVWEIAIDDPRVEDGELATLRIGGARGRTWGVATSGTSVHRWSDGPQPRHHLIDPRTGRPAVTDVVQATVVADSALRSEACAKAAVIAGSVRGFALLDCAPIRGAVLLLEDGRVLALPKTLALLAEAA